MWWVFSCGSDGSCGPVGSRGSGGSRGCGDSLWSGAEVRFVNAVTAGGSVKFLP